MGNTSTLMPHLHLWLNCLLPPQMIPLKPEKAVDGGILMPKMPVEWDLFN